jgi:hypothetical protein
MEPPPASLEAMVRSGSGSSADVARMSPWAWVTVLVAIGAVVTVYLVLAPR